MTEGGECVLLFQREKRGDKNGKGGNSNKTPHEPKVSNHYSSTRKLVEFELIIRIFLESAPAEVERGKQDVVFIQLANNSLGTFEQKGKKLDAGDKSQSWVGMEKVGPNWGGNNVTCYQRKKGWETLD